MRKYKKIWLDGEQYVKIVDDGVSTYIACHCFSGPENKSCDGKCSRVKLDATIIRNGRYA